MKPLLTIGLPIDKPYLHIENNSLHGAYVEYHRALNYFLYDKFNVNLIDCGPIGYDVCFENGTCSGSLRFLQNGRINFADKVSAGQLEMLPDNLTLGPIIKEDYCHLYNKPATRSNSQSQDFLDINRRLNWSVICVFFAFSLTFTSLIIIFNRLLFSSNQLTPWNLYEVALGHRFLPIIENYSLIGLTFSWFGFFLILIVTCTFQTGLIKSTSFVRIEAPNDILTYSLVPTTFSHRFCRYTIQKSTIPVYKKISRRLDILDRRFSNNTLYKSYELMDNDNRVFIAEEYFEVLYRGFKCRYTELNKLRGKRFYKSNKSFEHLLFFFVLSESTAPEVARVAISYASRAFETSNLMNHFLWKLITRGTGPDNYFSPCAQDMANDGKISLASLSMKYFTRPVLVLTLGSIVVTIIFLVEIVYFKFNSNVIITKSFKNQLIESRKS